MERVWLKHYPPQVPHEIEVPEISVSQILTNSAEQFPQNIALTFAPTRAEMSYRELEEKTNFFAGALQKLGIKKGDRVAMMLPNTFETVITFFGALRRGTIVVPLNPRYTPRELQYMLTDSGARMIVCLEEMYPIIKEIPGVEKIITVSMGTSSGFSGIPFQTLLMSEAQREEVKINPNDPAVIQYTAGTTGIPKGVVITHRNIVANVIQITRFCWTMQEGKEEFIVAVPPFHVAGLTNIITWGIYLAANLVLLPKFDPVETLQAITNYTPSFFFGVPAMYAALLKIMQESRKKEKFEFLKFSAIGTAPCPFLLFKALKEIFPELTEGYGLTETTGVCFANPIGGLKKDGSVGIPFPGVEVKIIDEFEKEVNAGEKGEIIIKGPNVSPGYWNLPEETKENFKDGWVRTGDVGYLDEDGYLYIVDRIKDIINVRGEKVASREVENILQLHPSVAEAAVIGIPDPYWGEKVVAYLALKEPVNVEEILEHCRKYLTGYKVPKEIKIVESLPKSAVGKVLKRILREQVVP
jgi:long-chain acyl-CoA synthetase